MKVLLENFKVALQALILNKSRSFLTMLGIIIGVGSVVAVMSIGTGAQQMIMESIEGIGSNLIIIIPGEPSEEENSFTGSSPQNIESLIGVEIQDQLKMKDVKAIEKEANLIEGVSPVILNSSIISYRNRNTRTSVFASTGNALEIYNFEIDKGKFYNSSDIANSSNVAVLGPTTSKKLFGKSEPTGKIIKIDGKNFTVIGTTKSIGANPFGQDLDDMVTIPITAAQNKLYSVDYLNLILAKGISEDKIDEAEDELKKILRKQHNISPGEKDDFTVRNQTQILGVINMITNIFTITLSGIAAISLLVGGIGIMNIMLVSVTERTKEIGIRKAVGAKNRDLLIQFLTESIILSIIGGVLGIAFAISISLILNRYTILHTNITVFPIIIALSFSTIIGLFFGIYPAMRAARLNPIDSLRYE